MEFAFSDIAWDIDIWLLSDFRALDFQILISDFPSFAFSDIDIWLFKLRIFRYWYLTFQASHFQILISDFSSFAFSDIGIWLLRLSIFRYWYLTSEALDFQILISDFPSFAFSDIDIWLLRLWIFRYWYLEFRHCIAADIDIWICAFVCTLCFVIILILKLILALVFLYENYAFMWFWNKILKYHFESFWLYETRFFWSQFFKDT